MIEFTLPLPCSVNELYTVARGRKVLSRKAKAWKDEAFFLTLKSLNGNARNIIIGHASIRYDFTFPDHRKRDISNYIKQVEDMIVYAGLIEDDSLVMAFSATKTIVKGVREVRVKVEEIKDE